MSFILNRCAPSEYRHEMKFVFPTMDPKMIEAKIKTHPALFSEVYYPRWVNTIYYDVPTLTAYYSSLNGVSPRMKARVRWYGDFYGEIRPSLEFKLKKAYKNAKVTFALNRHSIVSGMPIREIRQALINSENLDKEIKSEVKLLNPVLVSRYLRRYYVSDCGRFRVTLDSHLSFATLLKRHLLPDLDRMHRQPAIVELKFADDQKEASRIAQDFGFRFHMRRMSKYTTGMEYT